MVAATPTSLFSPLDVRAILVPNEVVHYAQRQHWASVVQPIYETFIFLAFVVWVVGLAGSAPATGPFNTGILIILIGAAVHAGAMVVNGRNPMSRLAVDPFTNRKTGPSRITRWLAAIGIAFLLYQLGIGRGGIVAVTVVIGRLMVIIAQWAFYERRYITDRRLIEAGGFLKSRINSMPLTRVTDISFSRTLPAELFGYATMRIETAGQDQALGTVRYIANPGQFYSVLVSLSAPPAPGAPPRAREEF